MPFDGSGNYVVPAGTAGVPNTVIDSTKYNTLLSDLQTALTLCVTRNGQSAAQANLPMGGFKLTGLGAGATAGDSLRWEQLFSQGAETAIVSAATLDIGAVNSSFLRVTGSTGPITSLGTNYNGPRWLRFVDAAPASLTYNATTLITPLATDVTLVQGDVVVAWPKATSTTPDGWIVQVLRASVTPAQLQNQTYTAFTTAGTSTAYTLDLTPNVTLATNVKVQATIHTANGATPTLSVDGGTAKAIKLYTSAGAKRDPAVGELAQDSIWEFVYDGTHWTSDAKAPQMATATPAVGTAAGTVGTGVLSARDDHAHPPMSGSVIQKVISTDATVLGPLSGSIPADDTIPQSSEGDLVFSFPAFTPKSASSTLVIHVNLWGSTSSSFAYPTWAVFNSGSANAIGAGRGWPDNGSGNAGGITIIAKEASASTSARTYTVRVGISGGNWYINGNTTGTRRFGGVSFIVGTIEEIAA